MSKSNIWNKSVGDILSHTFPGNGRLAWTLSRLIFVVFFVDCWVIIQSYAQPYDIARTSDLQVIGRILAFMMLAMVLLLSTLQRHVYWDFRKNKTVLDERQISVRRRIFERSYKLGTLIVAVAFWIILANKDWIIQNQLRPFAGNDMFWIPIDLVVLLLALPPIIAAGQKDS